MSFHAGQTFTFGEQPSATKWQYLWDNDYALADGSGVSDDVIGSRQIQLANNAGLNALNASAVEKELLRLDNDNYLRLAQLPYQSNTTNSTLENVLIQSGWGFIPGSGSSFASETVTFPATFATVNALTISAIGYKDGSDPSGITDFSSWEIPNFNCTAPLTTGFTAFVGLIDGSTFSSNRRIGYSWIAIGTKA